MNAGDRLRRLVVSAGGAGFAPWAPGTFGSLVALLVVAACDRLFSFPWWGPLLPACAAAAATVALGRWIARHFGTGDPGAVVCDELCGQWIALAVPLRIAEPLTAYVAAFVLFRVLDVWKPCGIRRAERLPAGWGILMDDVFAGAAACAILHIGAQYL